MLGGEVHLEDFVISEILHNCDLPDAEKSRFIKQCRFSELLPSYLHKAFQSKRYTAIEVEIEGSGDLFGEVIEAIKPYISTQDANCGYYKKDSGCISLYY